VCVCVCVCVSECRCVWVCVCVLVQGQPANHVNSEILLCTPHMARWERGGGGGGAVQAKIELHKNNLKREDATKEIQNPFSWHSNRKNLGRNEYNRCHP